MDIDKTALFVPVEYQNVIYPVGVTPQIKEVSATFNSFNSKKIPLCQKYSLHTEPYLEKTKFKSSVYRENLEKYENRLTVELWKSEEWSVLFADFIISGIAKAQKESASVLQPSIIEVHPPRVKNCLDLSDFISRYIIFEEIIVKKYPNIKILIENRTSGGEFLVRSSNDIYRLSEMIDNRNIRLGIIADFPQLITSMCEKKYNNTISSVDDINMIIGPLKNSLHNIVGVHMSGKSHNPDFDTLFFGRNIDLKNYFFKKLVSLFSDSRKRFFVPEIHGKGIDKFGRNAVQVLLDYGFKF